MGNSIFSVVLYVFCDLAFSQILSYRLWHSHVVYDIEKPDTDGDSDLTRIRFTVHICINIILLIIVNKRGLKCRNEEFVGGSLGRG